MQFFFFLSQFFLTNGVPCKVTCKETAVANLFFSGGPPRRRSVTAVAMEIFEAHQGTHILQVF